MKGRWVPKVCALAFGSCLMLFFNPGIQRVPVIFRVLAAWPAVIGTLLWSMKERPSSVQTRLTRLSALLSLLWTLVWSLFWLAALAFPAQPDIDLIRRLGWINLAAIVVGTAAFLAFSRDPEPAPRTSGYWAVIGWCVAYVAWVNLLLEPSWRFFTGPALGGVLLVIAGWMFRQSLKNEAS